MNSDQQKNETIDSKSSHEKLLIKRQFKTIAINIIDVIILDLDVEGRKLSLGHKQTKENPWDLYEKDFALDTIHNAKISEIVEKGAIINFNDDISAFIPYRHLDKPDGSKLVKGELADFVVIEFNKEFKRVLVSHLLTHNMEVKEEKPEKGVKKTKSKKQEEKPEKEVKKTKSTKSKKKEEKPEKEVKKTKSTKSKKKDD